jgi:hypothetical protein
METYRTWARLFELERNYSWIVYRFHTSTLMYQLIAHAKDYDFGWLEVRLLPLGFRLVFLTRSANSFAEAREERLKASGNPRQYDNLEKFVQEQTLLRRLVSESCLPCLELDISDNNTSAAVESIADWMEEPGGFYITDD